MRVVQGMRTTRIFVHGLDSSNQGTKATFFRQHYPDMILPNFPGSLEERMEALERVLQGRSNIILVGSSFGGLMGTLFALDNEERVRRLVLLAPALNLVEPETYEGRLISVPTWIYHGTGDEVIPIEVIKDIGAKLFKNLTFVELNDDHNLHSTFRDLPWEELLS
ncbi:MAG: alpha/beta hydrolase [Deltaproteobacteria bacterium]|nr:MAG: alpha/beta hydrolase [Deltaproteobacteria bacterium]RLB86663.1 MAG: alpha/beta hydrolase [Deltaproteobacteria bacterium]